MRYLCGFSVFSIGSVPGNFKYKVTIHLTSSKENIILIQHKKAIQLYDKGTFRDLNKILPATRFKNFLGQDGMTLQYFIEVYDANEEPEKTKVSDNINEDLIRSLECPICIEYMTKPIYNCVKGHSICNLCKKNVEKCPLCQVNITDARNYVLEEIAEKTIVRCPKASEGCPFTGNIKNMTTHERNCYF